MTTSTAYGLPEVALALADENKAGYAGIKIRLGWDRGAPRVLYDRYWVGKRCADGRLAFERGYYPNDLRLADHTYRLVHADGRVQYVSEPYGSNLEVEDLVKFVERAGDEWDVTFGEYPLYFPGRTMQLIFERKAAA